MDKRKGRTFEDEVGRWLHEAIQEGIFGFAPGSVCIDVRHGLYSRDRGSTITFDIVLQIYRKSAREPFLRWLWECKNYRHPVPVDDLEEFHAKIEQVGRDNTKGTMISTSGFQAGATNFAQANGIGLMRVVSSESQKEPVARSHPSGSGSLVGKFSELAVVFSVAEVVPMPLLPLSLRRDSGEIRRQRSRELIRGADSPEDCYVFQDSSGKLAKCKTWKQVLSLALNTAISG